MKCPRCGQPIPEGQSYYCPSCYTRLEAPSFWGWLFGFLRPASKPAAAGSGTTVVTPRTTFIIRTNAAGEQHEYHSLEEVPAQLRNVVERATAQRRAGQTVERIVVRDAAGRERTYASLDEMPSDLRAAVEKARGNRG
jgi:hypothetical protein